MKVLVVDDDRLVRLLLRKILQQEPDCEVFEASNGAEAWKKLQEGLRPDLCLLDSMMPQMDGIELLQRMRADRRLKRLKVIMCTAVNDRSRVIQAQSLDVDSYLLKPLIPSKILAEIDRALGRPGASQNTPSRAELYQKVISNLPGSPSSATP